MGAGAEGGTEGTPIAEEALKGGAGEAGLLLGDLYYGNAHFVKASPEVKQDAVKAMAYYRAGAEQGCADAMYRLGCCYYCLLYTSPSPRD